MIVVPGPSLGAAEAAWRASAGQLPVWVASPGDADVGVERQVVACDPVAVVRSLDRMETAWQELRARWNGGPGVPVGIGYLSYDLGRASSDPRWPELEFRFYDALWVLTAAGAEIWACDRAAADRLTRRLDRPVPVSTDLQLGPFTAVEPRERHAAGVARILEYLAAGDAYQVNLARRLVAPLRAAGPPGLALFVRLQAESPAPHAFWMADGTRALVGNSPERFLRLGTDGRLETRPIKGTRPRGDAAAPDELAASSKDRAEHTMIVDLERNDLGRVCATGTVNVESFARVVTLPTVHHLVSTVAGRIRPGVRLPELIEATFPGGSITGAPKRRAMEIIDELEPARRGPYTGATGWLGAAGDLDLAIAIRTALLDDEQLTLWVGGGIVIDSLPDDELAETDVKAAAFARLCE